MNPVTSKLPAPFVCVLAHNVYVGPQAAHSGYGSAIVCVPCELLHADTHRKMWGPHQPLARMGCSQQATQRTRYDTANNVCTDGRGCYVLQHLTQPTAQVPAQPLVRVCRIRSATGRSLLCVHALTLCHLQGRQAAHNAYSADLQD